MKGIIMKVWITKYALTQGIYEADAELCTSVKDGSMISVKHEKHYYEQYFHGKDKEWTLDKITATIIANNMRSKRIASLQKQIAKIEKLNFETM
jgi:hypothetical protein